jgi:hypothetical protein
MLGDMTDRHPASLSAEELLAACDIRRERRGGPGGQHRNKVETAVVLMHRPTGMTAEANERRSQAENREQAIRRLRVKLAIAVRSQPAQEPPAVPSTLWQRRCAAGRIAVSIAHEDYPTILAEALDTIAVAEFDAPAAARWLGVSVSQLMKLLRREPSAWKLVNDARRTRGQKPLQ